MTARALSAACDRPWRRATEATSASARPPTTSSSRKTWADSQDAPGNSCSNAAASGGSAEAAPLRAPPRLLDGDGLSSGLHRDLDPGAPLTPARPMASRSSLLPANAWACSTVGNRCMTYTSCLSAGSTITSASVQPCSLRSPSTLSYDRAPCGVVLDLMPDQQRLPVPCVRLSLVGHSLGPILLLYIMGPTQMSRGRFGIHCTQVPASAASPSHRDRDTSAP